MIWGLLKIERSNHVISTCNNMYGILFELYMNSWMRDLKQVSFVYGFLFKLDVNGFCIFAIRFVMYSGFTRKDLSYILVLWCWLMCCLMVLWSDRMTCESLWKCGCFITCIRHYTHTLVCMIYVNQNLGQHNMIFGQYIKPHPPWKDICRLEKKNYYVWNTKHRF